MKRFFYTKQLSILLLIFLVSNGSYGQSKYREFKRRSNQRLTLETFSYKVDNPNIVKYTICQQSVISNSYFELFNNQYRFLYYEYLSYDDLNITDCLPEHLPSDTIIPSLNFSDLYYWSNTGKLIKTQLTFDTLETKHYITPLVSMFKPKLNELSKKNKHNIVYFISPYENELDIDKREKSNKYDPKFANFYVLNYYELGDSSIDLDSVFLHDHFYIDTNEYISLYYGNRIIDTLKFNDINETFLNSRVYLHKPTLDDGLIIPYGKENLEILSNFENSRKLRRIQKRKH